MIPVLTPEEMTEVDRAAPEPVDVLVRRAAGAVARAATDLLGGTYGRRVVVVAGPGNNGEDGRVAAAMLERRGVRTRVFPVDDAPGVLPEADLVIDAAFGTGFRGTYDFPHPGVAPVLAVDIPSGISGLTGRASGTPVRAAATVTFAALKPGLLFADGPGHAGALRLVDIGLDVSGATVHLVTDDDVDAWVPRRAPDAHKWRHAVRLVAGSPGMTGAAHLCAGAALRGGSGYVEWCSPLGAAHGADAHRAPVEVVGHPLAGESWAPEIVGGSGRFAAVAIGPGLGRDESTVREVRAVAAGVPRPLVIDGDGLWALGENAPFLLRDRPAPTVLTPHEGEFERLAGHPPGEDRIAEARALAAACNSVVLLKGPTTVVVGPDGQALVVHAGDARLATAGTGDVLTGLVAAHLALGADPLRGTAAAAQRHAAAALLGDPRGLVASDLLELIPAASA